MRDGVPGYVAAGVACGIKRSGAPDLALVVSERPAAAAGLFTTNRFPGAPVIVSRRNLRGRRAQAIVVNSGISNVATGAAGVRDAERMAVCAAAYAGTVPQLVQVASTGVIGARLPIRKIERGIRAAARDLRPDGFRDAARAILTTDTRTKLARAESRTFALLGFAKGSGMIQPGMATLLAYLVTDLAVEKGFLRAALRRAVAASFNRLTIDGEMSTSDTVLLLANGAAGNRPIDARSRGAAAFQKALSEVCEELVVQLAADGEGVTRLADVRVRGARTHREADQVARKVANSALVKTALFGSDPNWGRIVQAIGAAGVPLERETLSIRIAGVELLRRGVAIADPALRRRAERAMKSGRVEIAISLGRGPGRAEVLTTDLSYDYVRINSEYTT